jgi:murein DD-endopeptidase MepM/ murein hydrolase activator NlpD
LPVHEEPQLALTVHRVEPGETVFGIAKKYGVSVDELLSANGLSDARDLPAGKELVIPGAPPIARPDPPAKPAPPRIHRAESRAMPRLASRSADSLAGSLAWPLRGVLYARFGRKGHEPHDGIDLAAPAGTPVRAAADGTVLFAGEQRAYGRIVILRHANGLITLYAHNRELKVKTDQRVKLGQVIAAVGESGRTSGPHLHFEVRKGTVPVDPLEYLGPIPVS